MKSSSFMAVRLIVFLLVMLSVAGFSVYGDENTVDLASFVLDAFDGNTNHEWAFGGRNYSYDFEWKVDASKFASNLDDDKYPKISYIPGWPMAIYGTNRNGPEIKSLGIWGKFDRRGYNWIDIYPVKVGGEGDGEEPELFEIPIPGRIQYLDMWVWGSNLNYYLEAYFRDHQGVVHTIYMGNLWFQGWKNLRARVPTNIPQSKRVLPRLAGLSFIKFRLWTTPIERVDNFYVYFNHFKVLTDTFESMFDGDDLADPDTVQELWTQY
jgi:hypothetical protein